MNQVRCAIYTRKSSDEGLDQAFNSLDAQHEACSAYIASQRHEGWKQAKARYDDGGVSGGTLERPALQRLMADIEAGRVDMVVVYKIDRLTRSLADFARLIETLDAAGASFVSVTQQFNTSTSMGRLTLNVLLSFAQFEREVTAERIRDKIAASKKKGMWMGGLLPLGYDKGPDGLVINEHEAASVRTLFEAYLDLGCVRKLKAFADTQGIWTKQQTFKSGRKVGDGSFSRGALYHLLSNPIYAGHVRHKDQTYPGLHHAIIREDLWQRVQGQLAENKIIRASRRNASLPSPLAGKLFDGSGTPLTPSHATKSGRRYRYYVSKRLLVDAGTDGAGWRLPAREVESAVELAISEALDKEEVKPRDTRDRRVMYERLETVRVHEAHLSLKLSGQGEEITVPFTLQRRGVEQKLCLGKQPREPDLVLIRRIKRARTWAGQIVAGAGISEIARTEGVSPEFIGNNLKLAFLSPAILNVILEGRQRQDLTAQHLYRTPIPIHWIDQEQKFL